MLTIITLCVLDQILCVSHILSKGTANFVFGSLRVTIHVKYLRYSSAGGGVADLGVM